MSNSDRFAHLRIVAVAANSVKLSYEPILPVEIFGEGAEAYSNVGAKGYPETHTIFVVFNGMGPIVETKFGPASFPQLTDMESGAQLQVPGHTSLVKQLTDYYRVGDELAVTCFGPNRDEKGVPKRSAKGAPPILWRATLLSELEGKQYAGTLAPASESVPESDFDSIPSISEHDRAAASKSKLVKK